MHRRLTWHHAHARRCELLQRTRSVIHRRGDSFSSLRSDEGGDGEPDQAAGPRPIFFIHGVGLGLVRRHAFEQSASDWGSSGCLHTAPV